MHPIANLALRMENEDSKLMLNYENEKHHVPNDPRLNMDRIGGFHLRLYQLLDHLRLHGPTGSVS